MRHSTPGTGANDGTAPSSAAGLRSRMSLKRASSNWGLGSLRDLLHRHDDEDEDEKQRFDMSQKIHYNHQNWNSVGKGKTH